MMKKIILFFVFLSTLNAVTVYSFPVSLDLNQNTGIEPIDVNLTATVLEGAQTRTCTDLSACGTEFNKPDELQACGACTNGTTMNCTTAQNCPGIQTCSGSLWGACVDVPDSCPPTNPSITVSQERPIEDINVLQGMPFTFTTSVTCHDLDCGNITATLDPLVEGTNYGFVTIAPTADPDGAGESAINSRMRAFKIVAPEDATITEMGFYVNAVSEETNCQLGIYSHDAINDRAATRLAYSGDFAKGITAGWKTATVDYEFTLGTTYWLAVQCDNTATATFMDITANSIGRSEYFTVQSSLAASYGAPSGFGTFEHSIYALYKGSGPQAKGQVSTTVGATPFYTSSSNPQTCVNLLAGQTCTNIWTVIPTAAAGEKYRFFVDYVPADASIQPKKTNDMNLTISSTQNCLDNDLDSFNDYESEYCSNGTDCDAGNPGINPSATEVCGNLIDDDCDNQIDETCSACIENWNCSTWGLCESGIPPYVFEWDFDGDGITDSIINSPANSIIHTYSVGQYNARITVTDVRLEQGTDSGSISVALPNGNFPPDANSGGTYISGIITGGIQLNGSGFDSDGSIISYFWEAENTRGTPDCIFNNPAIQNPIITCTGIGTAEIRLTVTDNLGAQNTDITTIRIVQVQTEDKINIVQMTLEP
ncbi:MAG: MopE-related protein, partial [archaeon]